MQLKMMSRVLAPIALATAVAVAWWIRTPHVSASLYDLVGAEAKRIPPFLREASASEIAIIVSSPDAAQAELGARKLSDEFPVSDDLPPGALGFVRDHRGGLVTRETAELLRSAEGRAKIAKRAIRRLYSSPLPPVLGYEDDPFGLTDAWLLSLPSSRIAKTSEGWPRLVTNGVTRILLRHRLAPEIVADIDRTIVALDELNEACHRLEESSGLSSRRVRIRLAGAPVHAATSARRCKREIGRLTWFSLVVIAGLAFGAFRTLRWLPLLACSLLVAALAGAVVLIAFSREIHVLTIVMGTTVLGLVIDYSFHWLLSPDGGQERVRKNLLVSFLTTEISLVPLMLASIPVLRQSAVFLGTGLAATLGYVLACYPSGVRCARQPVCDNKKGSRLLRVSYPLLVVVGVLLLAVGVQGFLRVSFKTDVSALYRPTPELLEAERERAQFGEFDFSLVPTLDERRTNAAYVRTLYGEHAAKLMETLGVRSLPVPLEPTERLVRPNVLMNEIFGVWTADALRRLALSILALIVVVVCFFRRRCVRVLAPPVLALLLVVSALGWLGMSVNLFHILAAFLLLGMGVDYAVFLESGDRSALKPALCSLLTSVAGFGALAFVSFPVVTSFGAVLGIGLPVAFGAALLVGAKSIRDGRETASVSTEHGASLLGMEILFLLYRFFGLRVLHLLSALVGFSIWTFSPTVRRASPSLCKTCLFTRSLADKLVVLANGRSLPRVETDGSADATAFVDDVRSGRGVFVLSSHVGTIEVLTALGACDRMFHAWMDFERTGVFNCFYLRHAKRPRVRIHSIAEFGMGTVFEAGDWIDGGDCLVMAGDRGDGAFRFAAAFDHPIYFVACVAGRGSHYRAVIRRLPSDRLEMKSAYEGILADLIWRHPDQHFVWEPSVVV